MSLFGAMNTAISGLNAQSAAFSNIGDNVANSQTIGYKRIDTRFADYLTTSTAQLNESGSVVATPDYVNTVQGTVATSDNKLALAITGQGFFSVSQQNGTQDGKPTFSAKTEYTRAGDFSMNKDGYIKNGFGLVLNGWQVDPQTGVVDRSSVAPIQISQSTYNPVATSEVSLAANLPATPTNAGAVNSQVQVYDGLGTAHSVSLSWTQTSPNNWTLNVNAPDATNGPALGTANVQFGNTSGNDVPSGTPGALGGATGTVSTTGYAAGGPASVSFSADFGQGAQTVSLKLGTFGGTDGVTQYAGNDYTLKGLTQNGIPPGSYSSLSMASSGDVVVNYDNGQSRTVARVPITTFADPDALQREDGQAFTATIGAGTGLTQDAGNNGAGDLVTSATESSNVDIAKEFTKLIVAQRAYSANTKLVTTADELLQQTIDMKR